MLRKILVTLLFLPMMALAGGPDYAPHPPTWPEGFALDIFGGYASGINQFELKNNTNTSTVSVNDLGYQSVAAQLGLGFGYDLGSNVNLGALLFYRSLPTTSGDVKTSAASNGSFNGYDMAYGAGLQFDIGYAFWQRVTAYIAAGPEYARVRYHVVDFGGNTNEDLTKNEFGALVGGGLKFAVTDGLLIRVEYTYNIFSRINERFGPAGNVSNTWFNPSYGLFGIGLTAYL